MKNFAQAQALPANDLPDSVLTSKFHHTPKALGYVIWDDLLAAEHLKDLTQEVRYRINRLPMNTNEETQKKSKLNAEFEGYISLKSHWMKLKTMLKTLEKDACTQDKRRYEALGFKQMDPSIDLFPKLDD